MPTLERDGRKLHYRVDGPEGAPWLLLLNSLGTDLSMWEPQLALVAQGHRVIRYDQRGHGASAALAGDYTLAELAGDALLLMDTVGAARAHVCGISLGGMIAMWLGVHAAERVDKLVLANTSARIGTTSGWNERIADVRARGSVAPLADAAIERWFSPAFRTRERERVEHMRGVLATVDVAGYVGCCAALRDGDLREAVRQITAPTLIIAGRRDPVTTPADGHALAAAIPLSDYVELDAAHLSSLDADAAFTNQLLAFFSRPARKHEQERQREGLTARREVLGDAHVTRAIAAVTPFNGPFQELITRYAWGEIWTRPGLPRHTRSLLTIAMLVALNREHELRLHLRAAKNSGVTREQIMEVLLQSAIYCGVPAANAAFRTAEELFGEEDASR